MAESKTFIRPEADPMVGVPKHTLDLLDRLHKESLEQAKTRDFKNFSTFTDEEKATYVRDMFVALDKDKAQYVYALLRAIDARTIVEAGTSFGVSTIYLALAASQNASAGGKPARVIATEHEPVKADKAREYWKECGDAMNVVDLRVGDLRETLKDNVEKVDFLLLDIWTPMVMPTVELIKPKLRRGAIIVADNTLSSKGYDDYCDYVRNPENGFVNLTIPYSNGLEMSIYLPSVSQ